MVKYDPSVMVLASIGVLAHVEPANALRQHHDRSKWGGRHHVCDPFSCDPLQAHQQRELALHGSSQGQGVAQKAKHRPRRPRLPFVDGCLTVRRVRYDAAATFSDTAAGQEIDTRSAKPAISDIG